MPSKGDIMKGCFALVMLAICSIVSGTVIHVPGDYPTIQAGLNAASSGDTALVAPGIYLENIEWPSLNGIKLFSELGSDFTIIDGSAVSHVLYLSGGDTIDTNTVIKGFTIQ